MTSSKTVTISRKELESYLEEVRGLQADLEQLRKKMAPSAPRPAATTIEPRVGTREVST